MKLLETYPDFIEVFESVSAYVHSGVPLPFIYGYASNWIAARMSKQHQAQAMSKVRQWVEAIGGGSCDTHRS